MNSGIKIRELHRACVFRRVLPVSGEEKGGEEREGEGERERKGRKRDETE